MIFWSKSFSMGFLIQNEWFFFISVKPRLCNLKGASSSSIISRNLTNPNSVDFFWKNKKVLIFVTIILKGISENSYYHASLVRAVPKPLIFWRSWGHD